MPAVVLGNALRPKARPCSPPVLAVPYIAQILWYSAITIQHMVTFGWPETSSQVCRSPGTEHLWCQPKAAMDGSPERLHPSRGLWLK